MTLAAENRLQDALALLKALFLALGTSAIDCTIFDSDQFEVEPFKKTSWDELVHEGLLTSLGEGLYSLSADGWSEALFRYGNPASQVLAGPLGILSKNLKDRVKGRSRRALISLDQLAASSGLPSGWIFNVIDSHLISRLYGKKDAAWASEGRGRMIEIPRDFGLDRVDLFSDLRSQNRKLVADLEQVKELYSDYQCELCSAPLVVRGSWEHEYGSEEVLEYECGMTKGSPCGDTPCTKDPSFPKFEDYTLHIRKDKNDYFCTARPTDPKSKASRVWLRETFGETKEDAQEAMREQYIRRAVIWEAPEVDEYHEGTCPQLRIPLKRCVQRAAQYRLY